MLTGLFVCDVQVAVMQLELTALQPELIETAKQTDQMMVKIEKETVEVDAKKELVSADEKVANEAAAAAKAIKVTSVHQSITFLSKGPGRISARVNLQRFSMRFLCSHPSDFC